MRTLLAPALLFAVAAVSLPVMAQTTSAPSTRPADGVPVTRVALFSSGVGYFEHVGRVTGDATSALRFKTEQVNDVLKSLVLQDFDGGTVSTVSYQSQDPLDRALKGFQVDLSGSPAIAQLLGQLRGAEVVVTTSGNKFAGKILGVETRRRAGGDDQGALDVPTLTLVTSVGIQAVAIDDATAIQLVDPTLQAELNKALAAVAGARDSDKKTVTVNFKGTGDRRVRLGYVVATPVWKTSYRLMLADGDGATGGAAGGSNLQGWAIVENQTDADWNGVQLSLVSGRPISFQMDLYQPMYLARPTARLELFAGLTPQTYAEAREEVEMQASPAPAAMASRAAKMESRARGGGGGGDSFGGAADTMMLPVDDEAANAAVVAQATAGQIGELFEYALSNITLARQSSAMVPIITDPIEATPVSIYNQSVLARHPLTGARLKNTTDKHLLQGPITVFAGGGYAGDAQINNVPPGQERLISYGIDLGTLVDAEKVDDTTELQSVSILKGVLQVTNKTVSARRYAMQNKSARAKTILVEHPKNANWELVDTDKPVETTDTIYRFERKLEAGAGAELVVKQQIVSRSALAILSTEPRQLQWYVTSGKTPPAVKEALTKAFALREEQATLDRQINEANEQSAKITQEQTRIRENMRTVDKGSAYYGRLMAKLDEQESTIERTQTKVGELTEQRDAKRAELEAYVGGLSIG